MNRVQPTATDSTKQRRRVTAITRGVETADGAGVRLRRLIASPELNMLDPFLLLDVFNSDKPDDYIAGFPPHPHRGFETVTYLLAGRMRHRDSTGHAGVIKAGGVQWMTAGRGIEHSEMPEQERGLLRGFQLWINLPAARKMTAPRYQEFEPEAIPVELRPGNIEVRVIAGITVAGTRGPVQDSDADALYLDITLPAASDFREAIPVGHNAFIYVISGEVHILDTDDQVRIVSAGHLAILGDGAELVLNGGPSASRLLLIAGRPFHEPVARSGPFVMNTQDEILQAYRDHRDGQFGTVEGDKP